MYRLEFDREVVKYIKRANPDLRDKTQEELERLKISPKLGVPLTGVFKGMLSYHFSHQGVAYRIVYEIFPEEGFIGIVAIGTREGVYKKLKRKL